MKDDDQFRVRMLRLRASAHEKHASFLRMQAKMVEATAAMRAFEESLQEAMDEEVATHPDLAELNVQMDGFYAED